MKREKKKYICFHAFTLVELLVAMAVFSILLLLMLQFFTGAQKLWVSTEQRNDLYANARVAMDLMSTLLQNTYYSSTGDYGMPFVIKNSDPDNSCIYFPTQTRLEGISGENAIRFVGFQRGQQDKNAHLLIMTFFSDDDDTGNAAFSYFFPPYDAGFLESIKDTDPAIEKAKRFKAACDKLVSILNAKRKIADNLSESDLAKGNYEENKDYAVLLDTVTGLSFFAQKYSTSAGGTEFTEEENGVPYLVEIRLSMMDKKNFELWKSMSADNIPTERVNLFRQQHEHTFTRAVFLGDRCDNSL